MSPKGDSLPTEPAGYEHVSCLTCGSVWRIERYTDGCKIDAELLICPLCVEREAKEEVAA